MPGTYTSSMVPKYILVKVDRNQDKNVQIFIRRGIASAIVSKTLDSSTTHVYEERIVLIVYVNVLPIVYKGKLS